MFESRVLDLLRRPDSEIVMARAFAHLLAHLAIHPRPPVGDEARARAEAEADETGVFFFAARRIPHHHAIWHLFVLGGSICHYVAIVLYVLPKRG